MLSGVVLAKIKQDTQWIPIGQKFNTPINNGTLRNEILFMKIRFGLYMYQKLRGIVVVRT